MFVVMSGDINLQFRFFCIFWCLCLCRKVPLAAIVRPWTRFGTQRVPGVNHFLFLFEHVGVWLEIPGCVVQASTAVCCSSVCVVLEPRGDLRGRDPCVIVSFYCILSKYCYCHGRVTLA